MASALPVEPSGLKTLRDILLLERKRGYDDRAVVGGLAALLDRVPGLDPLEGAPLRRLRAYGEQPPSERATTVTAVLDALDALVIARRDLDRSARDDALTPTLSRGERGRADASPPGRGRPTPRASGGRTGEGISPARQLDPQTRISALPGVGPSRAHRFASLGIHTAGELRFHLPHRYVSYPPPQKAADLGFQHLASFEGDVRKVDLAAMPGRRFRITAILGDATGTVAAVWIRSGTARTSIRVGARLAISGELTRYGRQVLFENPEYEPASDPPLNTRRIVPVYPLTAGISQQAMRAAARHALEGLPALGEWLPEHLRQDENLMGRDEAVRELHWPTSLDRLGEAQQRYAFDELLPLQLLVLQRRLAHQTALAVPVSAPWSLLAEFRRQLPFALTAGQQRVLSAILDDISQPRPMVRLLQGEVGSGKTVVAAMVLLAIIAAGGQAAMMAPTEILAEQHSRTLDALYGRAGGAVQAALGRPLRTELLTGALTRAQRQRALTAIAEGEVDVVVGTHAIIQGDVEFKRLVLAVVDEQHRFGVGQRVAMRQKGEGLHLLVMTATPIPRTLALTLYGDLDISVLDELPPGRSPTDTVLLHPRARGQAYQRVREEVAVGRQAFVICPLVAESASSEVRAATSEYHRLQRGELSGLRLALLHGRMVPAEKDRAMRAFAAREYDVLVATSVVEVGVDVPNATAMVVEGAERFGLAQLHQFRGRVGRGTEAAVCFLIAESEAPEALERLEAVIRSTNGLDLAEEDLRIRGPGEYFGLRQSGFPQFQVARISDLDFVQRVRTAAARLLEEDADLHKAEHAALARVVEALVREAGEPN